MMISLYTCIATCQLRTVAFVTKYNASVDMLSVSGELFIIVLTRAWGNIVDPSSIFGLKDDILV